MAPITLTLVFETRDQAMAVLEAYGDVMGDSAASASDGHVTTSNIPAYAPVPHPNPAPGYVSNGKETEWKSDGSSGVIPELDERGVPWHADHHSSNKKQSKGAWDRKRGHDRKKADTYEAQFVGKPVAAPAVASPAAAATMPAPSVQAPPPMTTKADFQNLWVWCCQNNKVTMDDQNHIITTWGAHPMVEGPHWDDNTRLAQAYAFLQTKLH
jgi:hypothetical protein